MEGLYSFGVAVTVTEVDGNVGRIEVKDIRASEELKDYYILHDNGSPKFCYHFA